MIPGANYDAASEWITSSLTVEHAWRARSLVAHPGDVVPADSGDADSNLTVDTPQSTGRYRWHLTFDAATGGSRTFRSATIVDNEEPPETGNALVDATFGGGFTKGFLRDSERDIATARLVIPQTSGRFDLPLKT